MTEAKRIEQERRDKLGMTVPNPDELVKADAQRVGMTSHWIAATALAPLGSPA
jgi:hypothetical protein